MKPKTELFIFDGANITKSKLIKVTPGGSNAIYQSSLEDDYELPQIGGASITFEKPDFALSENLLFIVGFADGKKPPVLLDGKIKYSKSRSFCSFKCNKFWSNFATRKKLLASGEIFGAVTKTTKSK